MVQVKWLNLKCIIGILVARFCYTLAYGTDYQEISYQGSYIQRG